MSACAERGYHQCVHYTKGSSTLTPILIYLPRPPRQRQKENPPAFLSRQMRCRARSQDEWLDPSTPVRNCPTSYCAPRPFYPKRSCSSMEPDYSP